MSLQLVYNDNKNRFSQILASLLHVVLELSVDLQEIERCVPVLLAMKGILIQDVLLIPVLNPPVESMPSALRTEYPVVFLALLQH